MENPIIFYVHSDVSEKHSMPQMRGKSSWTIDSYEEVVDPRPGKSGKCWIRLMPGERSIFVDEQSRPIDLLKIRKGEDKQAPIEFQEGRKSVDPSETLLLSYLRASKRNESNAAKNRHMGKMFYEWKPGAQSEKIAKEYGDDTNLRLELKRMPTDTLKILYRIMGPDVTYSKMDDMQLDEIRHNLHALIKKDPGQYEVLKNDGLLSVKQDVYEALDRGIIRTSPSNANAFFLTSTNTLIKEAPAGAIPIIWFAQYLYEKGGETLMNIRVQLNRNIIPDDQMEQDTDTAIELIVDFAANHAKGEELLPKIGSSNSRQFVDEDGNFHKMGIGWAGVKKTLTDNADLRLKVFQRYKALNP